jgi:guanylate kinase
MSNEDGAPIVHRRGLMLVLSSPSGAGKTTLSRQLLGNDSHISLSISCTTRDKRPGETDGVDYHFIDTPTFRGMIDRGEFLEHARVFDHYYGTPSPPVEQALGAGRDMLFDIDWQGARQVREARGADVVSVFILPPSMQELRARLERRAEDSAATIVQRLDNAKREIERWRLYDYVVVNDDLQRAYRQVVAILAAERARGARVEAGIEDFVATLLAG